MATKYKCRHSLTVADGTKYNPGDVVDLIGDELVVALSFGAVYPVEVETPQEAIKTPETPKTVATTATESKPAPAPEQPAQDSTPGQK